MIKIRTDFSEFVRAISPMKTANNWVPKIIGKEARVLGKKIVNIMKDEVAPHRYTGTLMNSIASEYESAGTTLIVGPTAKRGGYDAGVILEMGTKPIPNVPWAPIRAWARARGRFPVPVWNMIRDQGVKPHPFLLNTTRRSDFQSAIQDAADKIGQAISISILRGSETQIIP